jgi:hypothetical protein
VVDDALLQRLGLPIDQRTLLPDCLIVDLDPVNPEFWFVEAVFSDGPITEPRKEAFLAWAADNGLDVTQCRFLTAFTSRTKF